MDSPSVSTIVSCVPKSDRNAKHSSLYFTEDAVVVKPWYLENTELVDMVKDLILMQTAWIVSREKAIEDLLRTKFENKIEIFLERELQEEWADQAVIPQAMGSHTVQERDAVQIAWPELKAPDLVDQYKEHRRGQRARLEIWERPGCIPI